MGGSLLSFHPMVCNTTSPLLCRKLSENIQTHLQLHSFFQQVSSAYREQEDSRQRVPIQQHPRTSMVNMVRAGNVVTAPKQKPNGRSPVPCLGSQCQSWDKLPAPIHQSGLMLLQLPAGTGPEEKGSTISRSAWKTGQLFSPAAEGCLFWARFNSALSPSPSLQPTVRLKGTTCLGGAGHSPTWCDPSPGATLPFPSPSLSFSRLAPSRAGDALSCLAPGWPDSRHGAAKHHHTISPPQSWPKPHHFFILSATLST